LGGWTAGVTAATASLIALAFVSTPQLQMYTDPQQRFAFGYPAAFGAPERGTDDGYRERAAAVRFSRANVEAILTQGAVTVDRQALGGLYDTIARQVIPDAALPRILQAVTPVTAANFCQLLGASAHIIRPESLSAQELQMARAADALGNDAPRVISCQRAGETLTFHKESGVAAGQPRRHVFGAIRFLAAPYSSFQIIGAGGAPPAVELAAITAAVDSFRLR
jgi:hypothetical protein